MTNTEIVNILAREKRVETMAAAIGRSLPTEELEDISQNVYLAVLQMDNALLSDLYENGQVNFYLARVTKNTVLYALRTLKSEREHRKTYLESLEKT